ncbi:MAG TPA: ATP-binding protein [Clostridia bacterium]|nr:ATP-binding protein [Clostridia bacterium]
MKLGCKKVALGHHRDDVVETLFLSMFYGAKIKTFAPVTYLDRKDITLIRPLIYAPELEIINATRHLNIPLVYSPCPADGKTKREYIKNLLNDISRDIPNVQEQILSALKKSHKASLWEDRS